MYKIIIKFKDKSIRMLIEHLMSLTSNSVFIFIIKYLDWKLGTYKYMNT